MCKPLSALLLLLLPRHTILSCVLTILVYCQLLAIRSLLSPTMLIPLTTLIFSFLYYAFSIYRMLLRKMTPVVITNSCFLVFLENRTCAITTSGQLPCLPPSMKFTPTLSGGYYFYTDD